MPRLILTGLLLATFIICTGCIYGAYSKQVYGPPQGAMIAKDITVTDLVKNFGAPDDTVTTGDTKILVYKRLEGMQVLGVFGQMKKSDVIFVVHGEQVVESTVVPKGETLTILGVLSAPVIGPEVVKSE